MTPKEKAKELYDKMVQWQTDADIYIERNITSISAKHSALIAVDEMLKHMSFHLGQIGISTLEYWNQVKQEIKKL